uniref:(northern house mosquito) hypothetical protein n=1 Tax=Culex pipiens TaxID=7175 RepID=A0A8D8KJ33_CULPI
MTLLLVRFVKLVVVLRLRVGECLLERRVAPGVETQQKTLFPGCCYSNLLSLTYSLPRRDSSEYLREEICLLFRASGIVRYFASLLFFTLSFFSSACYNTQCTLFHSICIFFIGCFIFSYCSYFLLFSFHSVVCHSRFI